MRENRVKKERETKDSTGRVSTPGQLSVWVSLSPSLIERDLRDRSRERRRVAWDREGERESLFLCLSRSLTHSPLLPLSLSQWRSVTYFANPEETRWAESTDSQSLFALLSFSLYFHLLFSTIPFIFFFLPLSILCILLISSSSIISFWLLHKGMDEEFGVRERKEERMEEVWWKEKWSERRQRKEKDGERREGWMLRIVREGWWKDDEGKKKERNGEGGRKRNPRVEFFCRWKKFNISILPSFFLPSFFFHLHPPSLIKSFSFSLFLLSSLHPFFTSIFSFFLIQFLFYFPSPPFLSCLELQT